jgi:intracellular multiplication protein IcmO
LGKIVVASLRGMMARMLGARLEGDYSTIVANKPGMGSAPFHVVLDEVAYYATSGMDRMLAMGRSLNFMFWLGFQEVSGIWARLGEKTQSLFGNANLTIAMRQQDANRTRQWIEDTAGKTYVTQATSYQGGGTGEYAETRSAEVREVAGVEWRDLQSLIEGEAIILCGGRRIYAKLFHAEIDTRGPMRLNRPIPLAPPDIGPLKAQNERVEGVLKAFEQRLGTARTERSITLAAMLEAFKGAVTAGRGGDACIAAALEAAKDYPMARDEIDALAPQSPLEAMLQKAAERPPQASLAPLPVYAPREGANETQVDTLEGIEMAEGASRENAWAAATSLLAAGQGVEAPLRVAQTPTSDEIVRMIKALARDMRAEGLLEVGEPGTIENDRADESAWAQPRRAGP